MLNGKVTGQQAFGSWQGLLDVSIMPPMLRLGSLPALLLAYLLCPICVVNAH
jgi:hypothetical protein